MAKAEDVPVWMRPERPSRGPRPAYSRDRLAEAAVRVADEEGAAAVTMRRVAKEIGAGAMSLYRYVSGREDLVELMVDRVHGELELPERPSGDVRADLTLVAEQIRGMWLRHPWLATLQRLRPQHGPNQLRMGEFTLGALDRGQPIDDIFGLSGLLGGYVENAVRGEVTWAEIERSHGFTADDWMHKQSPYIRQLLDSGKYPMFARVVKDADQPHMDPEARFHYGLTRVLDAIESSLP